MTPEQQNPPEGVTRKGFIDWLLGTTVGAFAVAVVYPVTRYIIPPEVPEVTSDSEILPFGEDELPVNSGRIFKFGNKPAMVVKMASGEIRAFSAQCTHLDCTVQYRDDVQHIWCACHNGHYDLAGKNIQGPPPRPLPTYDVNIRGTQIIVTQPT